MIDFRLILEFCQLIIIIFIVSHNLWIKCNSNSMIKMIAFGVEMQNL